MVVNRKINQLASDAYLALHALTKKVAETEDDADSREMELEGESLIESFQDYLNMLKEREVL